MSPKQSSVFLFRLFVLFLFLLLFPFASTSDPTSQNDALSSYGHHKGHREASGHPVQEAVLGQSVEYLLGSRTSHSITINYHSREEAEETDTLLRSLIKPNNELSRSRIREIHVDGRSYYGNWTLVAAVFHGLNSLEDVHWYNDQPILAGILHSLETLNPSAKLHYYITFGRVNLISETEIEEEKNRIEARPRIANSMNLYSFVGNIDYGWKNNRQDDSGLVFQILTTCPNIRELDLTIGWSGCEVGGGQPFSFDFSSNHDAKFPPLEVLKLNGYDLESTSNIEWMKVPEWAHNFADDDTDEWEQQLEQFSLTRREYKSKDSGRMNLEEWLEAMEWSKIHTLQLTNASPKVMQLLSGPVLPSLKHFYLTIAYVDKSQKLTAAYEKFLNQTILPLESIAFQNVHDLDLNSILHVIGARHGPALKCLKLIGAQPKLAQSHISRLHAAAPNLESLDIDISRPLADTQTNGPQWDLSFLSSLASHPFLRHLTLRVPSSVTDPEEYRNGTGYPRAKDFYGYKGRTDGMEDGLVNHTSVAKLFTYLRESETTSGGEVVGLRGGLRELDIYVGDYEGRFNYGMLADEQCVLAHYTCSIDGDGDGGVKCKGEAAQNAYFG